MVSASDNNGNVATTEEIVAAVMAQMMPAMQKMSVSSTENAFPHSLLPLLTLMLPLLLLLPLLPVIRPSLLLLPSWPTLLLLPDRPSFPWRLPMPMFHLSRSGAISRLHWIPSFWTTLRG